VLGLPPEHLLGEVVDDVPVVTREGRDEGGRVGATLERQRGELQGGDPTLGAQFEARDILGSERQAPDGRGRS
jgi:hypothetical protein